MEYVVTIEKSPLGKYRVARILDAEFGMDLTRVSADRSADSVEDIAPTLWSHPLAPVQLRFREGQLYQLIEEERKVRWTLDNTSQALLRSL